VSEPPHHRKLAPLLKQYLTEHLSLRGVSANTVKAYRDAWSLLIRFGVEQRGLGPPEKWRILHIDRRLVLAFLRHLEETRGASIRTRNHRLAAIHGFFKFAQGLKPDLKDHCLPVLAIPYKKYRRVVVGYLEADEVRALLRSVPTGKSTSLRDLALLVFSYNTGARVHEIANARESDIFRGGSPFIRILGKGNKERDVPLWSVTLRLIDSYHASRRGGVPKTRYLFPGPQGRKLTRFHIGRIISHYIDKAAETNPNMATKKLHAHSMRHTTAVHLLQAGAELNTIKAWLGHASIESLEVYLDLDLKKKRTILEGLVSQSFPEGLERGSSSSTKSLLDWLKGI